MLSSVVIFCTTLSPVIVQNKCTTSYLTEASNVLYASKDAHSEIVTDSRHKTVPRANVYDSETFLKTNSLKTTGKKACFVQTFQYVAKSDIT